MKKALIGIGIFVALIIAVAAIAGGEQQTKTSPTPPAVGLADGSDPVWMGGPLH